jgi:hypothetical protein
VRRPFRTPLARWGFTVLAALAYGTGQYGAAAFCTVLAFYAWKVR